MKDKLRSQGGETLAEVLVAFAVLALFATLFLGAVRFVDRMLLAEQADDVSLVAVLRDLYDEEGQVTQQTAETYSFVTPEGTQAFSIAPPRRTVTVTVEENGRTRTYSFPQFAGEETP